MVDSLVDQGSFRDPSGRIFFQNGRVFRTVMPCAVDDFDYVESSGIIKTLEQDGLLVESRKVESDEFGNIASGASYILEHPRIPFVSHPYEWSFSALKAASLLHLDIHLRALEQNVTLSDASAYNVQFNGPNPIFIDRLSFKRYEEGEFWLGHKQFCEQFLNPLLLRAWFGVSHNSWYRGNLEGVTTEDIARLLPLRRKFSWKALTNIVLPASFQKKSTNEQVAKEIKSAPKRKFPRNVYKRMLISLRSWIEDLEPADTGSTVWGDYSKKHSYSDNEITKKHEFIAEFVKNQPPKTLWDLGCNTGDFSATAIKAGAQYVVGFDFDQKALEIAFSRAVSENLNFLPLYFDAANPSPNQGWAQVERKGMQARADTDAVLALAFVHHLAIARNVPIPEVMNWLIGFAPMGVVEFIPKSDPMIKSMLQLREDIFPDYDEKTFVQSLEQKADILDSRVVSASGRRLFAYRRH